MMDFVVMKMGTTVIAEKERELVQMREKRKSSKKYFFFLILNEGNFGNR